MAKTVTCKECGGVQAIFRDEEGKMHCAFCGEEITDLPPYEEGEGLDPAAEAEESTLAPQGQAAVAVFTLNRQEVEDALTLTGRLKPHRVTSIVETVLLAFLLVMQVITLVGGLLHWEGYAQPGLMTYLMLVVIAVLIPAVWIMPIRTNRRIVDRSVSGNELHIRVYENLCEVAVPKEDSSWNVEFGKDTFSLSECEDLLLLTLADRRLLAVAKRGFENEETAALARERLLSAAGGLTPFEPKALHRAGKTDFSKK